jgi:glycosyltransferase involved in cell wall biosynthesis
VERLGRWPEARAFVGLLSENRVVVPLFNQRRGGGVRIYQQGLIRRAVAEGHEVIYFSAGVRYNLLRKGLRAIGRDRPYQGGSVREFEIQNSPILAPSHHQFGRRVSVADNEHYREYLIDFINRHGPFDVLHLNSAEGIPLDLFRERERLQVGRIVMSLHNYHLLCQQVNLWHAEKVACTDYQNGRRCLRCVTPPSSLEVLAASTLHDLISGAVTEGSQAHKGLFYFYRRAKGVVRRLLALKRRVRLALSGASGPIAYPGPDGDVDFFRTHRHTALAMLNAGVDVAVPVSRRVAQIYQGAGVSESRLDTRYIATNFAAAFSPKAARERGRQRLAKSGATLNIAFLGYARRDKGFFFLLQALSALPQTVKRRIQVTVAARGALQHMSVIEDALDSFAEYRVLDGYSHDELAAITEDVDLGIIPVMWEDCLPQVAYEFVGNQVPIFAADMGGAQELVGPPALIFKAGDHADFARRLQALVENPSILSTFWDNERIPMLDWPAHWNELMDVYNRQPDELRSLESRALSA